MRVIDKCRFLFLLLCLPYISNAQYSNTWIVPSQQYFKIPVAKEGIYRLTRANLQAAGFPVNNDPRYIQIFHRGDEQSIYVKGQSDGNLGSSDFIEFYGQKNDGTLDAQLYKPSSLQPHKYYNIYSDTTAYFLTYSTDPSKVGARMDSTQDVNPGGSLSTETYLYNTRLLILHDEYSDGHQEDLTTATNFDRGEGWTGVALKPNQSADYAIDSIYNRATNSGNPKLELFLVSRDINTYGGIQIYVGPNTSSLRLLNTISIGNYNTNVVSSELNWSDIDSSTGKLIVRLSVPSNLSTNRPQVSMSYVKVTFPQNFNWNSQNKKNFNLEIKPSGISYLSITNPPANLRLWDITDQHNITRVLPTSSNPFNVVVEGTSVSKNLYSSSTFITPSVIPVSFNQVIPSAYNYILISNKVLMKPGGGYNNPVQAYADYRTSLAGGGYNTLIITMDQLYDQFNYGEVSTLAIYSFMKYMGQGNIKYLFLIGKGRDISYSPYQRKSLLPNEFLNLIPSAGEPGGDAAFTAGLYNSTYEAGIPTGRLTASSPSQVAAYLDKVKEFEAQPLQPWAKELLHLSGGGSSTEDAFELKQFRDVIDGFKLIAEAPYLGGHVTTQSKQNVGIEKINVSPIVNQGVNMMTFFGHSSSGTIDIDFGYVSDPTLGYTNKDGKYPVFLINGCNAGAIFLNKVTFSEDWMLTAQKGARNIIAGTSFGYSDDLAKYGDILYQVGFGDSTFIQKGIGDIQKEAGRRYLNGASDIFSVAQVQQMVLTGDPSLKLFGTSLPDYAVNASPVSLASLDNKAVTSISTSFGLKVIVKNLGAALPNSKPMRIRVTRTFNDNSSKSYDSIFNPTQYIDTLVFKIKKEKDTEGFGNNLFVIRIDPLNAIKEITKTNNFATFSAFIPSNGTSNLFPSNYGIVNSTMLKLVFQDADMLSLQKNYQVQLDTVNTFNSTFLKSQTVSGKVLAKTSVNLLSRDSTVYYWRTKPAKQTATDSANWTTSSFIYINNGPEGWAQTKFPQLMDDGLIQLESNASQEKVNFFQTISQINVKSIGVNSSSSFVNASMKIDGVEYNITEQVLCRNNTINLVAFNKQTAFPYPALSIYSNDARSCGLQPGVINSFTSSELQTADQLDLVHYVDAVNVSDSVILYSNGNPVFSSWPTNVLTKLNDLGISNNQITSLIDGEPVIIFAKKGAPAGSAKVYRTSTSPSTSQDLAMSATMTGRYSSGKIKSVAIGPAKKWMKFIAKTKSVEPVDVVSYSIYGLDLNGAETLIQSNVTSNLDLSSVDPAKYPQLKVQVNLRDSINLTAAQLKKWFVFYESVADGMLFYRGSLTPQTLQEGQTFTANYGFTNISSKSFTDSLQVKSDVLTLSKGTDSQSAFKIKAPAPGDTTRFSLSFNTKGKAGLNDIQVFVNPKLQSEQYYENNVIDLYSYLEVLADKSPPSLDVTVDGRYLQNGDFVSDSPVIQVKLHDDNPFLLVADTTHLNIYLSYPCDTIHCPFKQINFSQSDVQWAPASAKTDFTTSFHPVNLPDGKYTLQIIGTDASGNSNGTAPYQVSFQVKKETSFALKSVYPNPSTDIFKFDFVMSGNVLPEDFQLQIFSSEGQLIQQFDITDINNFNIGTNSILWSAKQSGVGNGLFVYRMTIHANGKSATSSGRIVFVK